MSVSALEKHLGYWLRCVSNHVSQEFSRRVEEHGATVAEWVVLRALFDLGEANPSQIAESIGLTRGAVSKLIDRLAAKKLASCAVERGDRRFLKVKLTAAGRKLVPRLAAAADQNDESLFGHMTGPERARLAETLQDLARRHGLKAAPVA